MEDEFSDEDHYDMLNNEVADVTGKIMNYKDYISMKYEEDEARELTGLTLEMIEQHKKLFNSLINNQNK